MSIPGHTRHSPSIGLMLGHRPRRWTNIKPTLGQLMSRVCRDHSRPGGNHLPSMDWQRCNLKSPRVDVDPDKWWHDGSSIQRCCTLTAFLILPPTPSSAIINNYVEYQHHSGRYGCRGFQRRSSAQNGEIVYPHSSIIMFACLYDEIYYIITRDKEVRDWVPWSRDSTWIRC